MGEMTEGLGPYMARMTASVVSYAFIFCNGRLRVYGESTAWF